VTLTYALLALFLLIANGFFVGAEFALIAARRTRIEELASEGDRRATLALASIRELSLMLAGAQLGITMASLALGYVAEPAVAHGLENLIGSAVELPEGVLNSISFVIALSIIVFLHMVIGEMAPKNIAIARPEQSALWLALPMRLFVNLLRPVIRLLNALANGGLRIMRVEPVDELATVHTATEISHMISESAEQGVLGKFKETLLSGAIELGQRVAASAMIPRPEMTAIPISATPAEIEKLSIETGYTRFPVYEEDLDHITGFIHTKDLLRVLESKRDQTLDPSLIRQMLVVPESRRLGPLLVDMRRERSHIALVVDEHGGTAGIVTLEDVLEELVGEIQDEYDPEELGIDRLGDDRFLIPGGLRIDEVESTLGIDLPEGEYETVQGFLMDRLGRIPKRRDVVEHNGWRLRVRNMYRRRVVQVLIERANKDEEES
jgi:CBS domain containing-hemolysin-like protein